jgi:glycolate oxidase
MTFTNDAQFDVSRINVLTRLRAIIPADCIVDSEEQLRPYECDGLSAYRETPLAVVLPETEQQAQAVLKLCHELSVPVVPRGAGTGLSGGALPHAQGITLSMAKMKAIKKVDRDAQIAIVQPGVRNIAISQAAAVHGLYYAPDPSSQIACTIGGNVAENSGGVHCLKYGLTVHNVLSVRVLLMSGEIIEFGSAAPDSPGLDLLALAIGSEGLLGLVTEVTVKLTPTPECAQLIMASFDNANTAGEAVAAIISAGIIPAGLELMDKATISAVEPFVKAGYDQQAAAILLVESDGTEAEVETEIKRMTAVLSNCGAKSVTVSENEQQRLLFWAGRKAAFPAIGRISPDYYCMDGTIPRKRLGEMLTAIEQMEKKYGLGCANVFHAGDGNLHPLIMFDANVEGELEKAEQFGAEILELSVKFGGSITGEHGVGAEKINQMCVQYGSDELTCFHAIKNAFDPAELLNPGKAVPSLHRCAEYGAMIVHKGQVPFPEIPRF